SKQEATLAFAREGNRYSMWDGKNTASILFLDLGDKWYAAQYSEQPDSYFYGIVHVLDREIDIVPLACDRLKTFAANAKGITYTGEDCSIGELGDPKAFFAGLIAKLPPAEMKLVPHS